MGAVAQDAIPHLHSLSSQLKRVKVPERADRAAKIIGKSAQREIQPSHRTDIRDDVRAGVSRVFEQLHLPLPSAPKIRVSPSLLLKLLCEDNLQVLFPETGTSHIL